MKTLYSTKTETHIDKNGKEYTHYTDEDCIICSAETMGWIPPNNNNQCGSGKWVSIKDKLPPDKKDVIAWDCHRYLTVWCDHLGENKDFVEWYWMDEGRDENWTGKDLTHWLDIEPPSNKPTEGNK